MKTSNKGSLLVAATVLLFSSVSHATLCAAEIAFPLGDGTEEDCKGDAACLAAQARADCIAVNAVSSTPRNCNLDTGSSHISASDYVKRQTDTLNCAALEVCYLYRAGTETSLLCMDRATGEYHDADGGRGNVRQGVYTDADGSVTTEATGTATQKSSGGQTTPTTSAAPGASVTDDEVTSIMSADGTEATQSVSRSGGAAQSSTTRSSLSATQSSGAAEQSGGAVASRLAKGALGLVAGVPLLMAVL